MIKKQKQKTKNKKTKTNKQTNKKQRYLPKCHNIIENFQLR